ncbi:MAG: VCBS repeat-containing protein [Anaerolineae bacterium]|nr:VCBS repeat-containing protein [Anaerolineae bacterium]
MLCKSNRKRLLAIGWGMALGALALCLAAGRVSADGVGLDPEASWVASEGDRGTCLAWGDVNGDGDLDLAIGEAGYVALHLNENGQLAPIRIWEVEANGVESIAWGDLDGDGDLDLAVGELNENKVYPNVNGMLRSQPVWSSMPGGNTTSIAWGDVDGDGMLDLAVGETYRVTVYRNVAGMLQPTPVWVVGHTGQQRTTVAWGDADGDDDLDLAAGYSDEGNKLYRNDGGVLQATAVWTSTETDQTMDVAWGDVNGDGDLDLAVANLDAPVKVYFNAGATLQTDAGWTAPVTKTSRSVAWGDVDGDGDLDLAVGNEAAPNQVYLNDGGDLGMEVDWASEDRDDTRDVAWGDVNGDGNLDLAAANTSLDKLYLNDGNALDTDSAWQAPNQANWRVQSMAWGDVDGDNDLDLVTGALGHTQLYLNANGTLEITPTWTASGYGNTLGVAWGDVDGDGDLDLATCTPGSVYVYLNEGGALQPDPAWESQGYQYANAIAWGDVDGDGDLDLALATEIDHPNRIYYNVGGSLQHTPGWESAETGISKNLAWGDVDGDGDLDLAFSNENTPVQLYVNVEGRLTDVGWLSDEVKQATSLTWGDVDGDGDLDLAVGNLSAPNQVYFNTGGRLQTDAGWASADTDDTYSIAWGDMDNDGDLDLVAGNLNTPSKVYTNEGGNLQPNATWISEGVTQTSTIAVGDVNNDGRLDLALGGIVDSRIYLGRHNAQSPRQIPMSSLTLAMAGGPTETFSHTVTALAPANFYAVPAIRQGTVRVSYTLAIPAGTQMGWVQGYYSTDGGGKWQVAVADTQTITRNLTAGEHTYTWDVLKSGLFGQSDNVVFRLRAYPFTQGNTGAITATYRYTAAVAGPYQQPYLAAQTFPFRVRGSQVRVISGTLPVSNAFVMRQTKGQLKATSYSDFNGEPFRTDALGYLQGRGQLQVGDQLVALAPVGTAGATTPVLAEGFEGSFPPTGWITYQTGTPDIPGWTLQVYGAKSGRQCAKHDEYETAGYSISWLVMPRITVPTDGELSFWQHDQYPDGDYYAYHGVWISAGNPDPQAGDYVELWSGDTGENWQEQRVNLSAYAGRQAYLAFRYEGDYADQWFIDDVTVEREGTVTRYDLYHTSATPISTGLTPYTVTALGVQTLTVSPANPLILFNLDVSLEWDARQDTLFLNQLKFDLQRASELLYDATNGQAAFGKLAIYHDKAHWSSAALQIHASNALIPNADVGGIVTAKTTRTISDNPYAVPGQTLPYTITYLPGAVRLGTVWSRYGEAEGIPGEDWPRALVHELGHYLFYLYDNYMGLNDAGALIPAPTCGNSLMGNPYASNEYRSAAGWAADCGNTLSARRNGGSDWDTLTTFYPALQADVWAGPLALPLAVTQISEVPPEEANTLLPEFIFTLTDAYGASLQPGANAQAILYQKERFVDLGHPEIDKVTARGARAGDRLCVYELDTANASTRPPRWGCETLTAGDTSLALVTPGAAWQPEILATPWNTATVAITVTNVPTGLVMMGRVYPHGGRASSPLLLTVAGDSYVATFDLPDPDTQALIQIWVDEAETKTNPRREAVTGYAIGGSAVCPGTRCSSGGDNLRLLSKDAAHAATGANFRPAVAPDGQVVLYADFTATEGFYTLQKATHLPQPLPWATVVGSGYYILQTPNAVPLTGTASINFRYRRQDVPAGEEAFLALYHWTGSQWVKLPTLRHPGYNEVTAPAQGPGLYALMSSLEIALPATGWNLASYPVQGTRPVTDALASIAGFYGLVYGYDATDTADPWKVYAPGGVPGWVNDLSTLHFGQGYWISATQPITWALKGATSTMARQLPTLITPPATYYGRVIAGPDFTPAAGMTVVASVEGRACAQATTQLYKGMIVYALNVGFTEATGACGAPGQTVTFTVNGQLMTATPAWQNDVHREVTLTTGPGLRYAYLPLITKNNH